MKKVAESWKSLAADKKEVKNMEINYFRFMKKQHKRIKRDMQEKWRFIQKAKIIP